MAAAAGVLFWPGTWSARASRCASTAGRERDTVVISVGAQGLRGLLREIAALCPGGEGKRLVLCMKGLEAGTGKRLTTLVEEELPQARAAVWLGPGHVQEFTAGIPNCMVIDSKDEALKIDSKDEALKEELVAAFSSELIRFYYGRDLIGNEIGGASKNVIGIAAGMLDGLGLSSLKGALMSRGTREIARLIKALGGNELSAYGLCHLGDYEATVFSPYSHNRRFGEAFVTGEPYGELAEGYATVKALVKLGHPGRAVLPQPEAGVLTRKEKGIRTTRGCLCFMGKSGFFQAALHQKGAHLGAVQAAVLQGLGQQDVVPRRHMA